MASQLKEFFSLENNTGLLALLFVVCFVTVVVATFAPNEFRESSGCQEDSPMMLCYSVSKKSCQATWDNFLEPCKDQINKNFGPAGPSALMGPKIQKCQKVFFDKTLKYSRRNLSDDKCATHFDYVDSNRREILGQ